MTEIKDPGHPTLTIDWDRISPDNGEVTGHLTLPDQRFPGGHPEINPYQAASIKSNYIDILSRDLMQDGSILCGDALAVLRTLPEEQFACCITSPPYWDNRYSGRRKGLGHETDHRDYIKAMVQVFREVRRTLTPPGTLWLVIGDTYASDERRWWAQFNEFPPGDPFSDRKIPEGYKSKDLMGIPWRLALALQDDGWYFRSDIIWSIPNHGPEPVRDRPARGHEYVFLFAKSEKYAYHGINSHSKQGTVWEIPRVPHPEIAYAVFPELLVERCMKAGSDKGEAVLDPFFGSGTVGVVAKRLKRRYTGIELDQEYVSIAGKRIRETGE